MIGKFSTIVVVAAATLSYAGVARAMDFPATPMNSGAPGNLPGEALLPGATEAAGLVNGLTQPILQPILAPGGAAPAAAEATIARPVRHHRRHKRRKVL